MKTLVSLILLAAIGCVLGCGSGASEANMKKNDQQIADANKKIDEQRTLPPGDGPLR